MIAQLDESVPARLAKALAAKGYRVLRFPNDWKGLKNGALLAKLRDQGRACLVTCDKNLEYQQSIASTGIALVVLPRQRFGDLAPLVESIALAIGSASPGEALLVGLDGNISRR